MKISRGSLLEIVISLFMLGIFSFCLVLTFTGIVVRTMSLPDPYSRLRTSSPHAAAMFTRAETGKNLPPKSNSRSVSLFTATLPQALSSTETPPPAPTFSETPLPTLPFTVTLEPTAMPDPAPAYAPQLVVPAAQPQAQPALYLTATPIYFFATPISCKCFQWVKNPVCSVENLILLAQAQACYDVCSQKVGAAFNRFDRNKDSLGSLPCMHGRATSTP